MAQYYYTCFVCNLCNKPDAEVWRPSVELLNADLLLIRSTCRMQYEAHEPHVS